MIKSASIKKSDLQDDIVLFTENLLNIVSSYECQQFSV